MARRMLHASSRCDVDWDEDEEDTIPARSLRPARVLIADDDEALRFLLTTRLVDEGYQVTEAESGNHVLLRIRERRRAVPDLPPFDLVLLDQRMPDGVGLDAVRAIRAQGERFPIILMTAFPDPALLEEAERLLVPILAKPFPLSKLSRLAARSIHARNQLPE